jgi:hypothetical protein
VLELEAELGGLLADELEDADVFVDEDKLVELLADELEGDGAFEDADGTARGIDREFVADDELVPVPVVVGAVCVGVPPWLSDVVELAADELESESWVVSVCETITVDGSLLPQASIAPVATTEDRCANFMTSPCPEHWTESACRTVDGFATPYRLTGDRCWRQEARRAVRQ